MLDDYPETRLAQKLFDDLPDHVRRAIYIMPGATPVDPKDPTRRRNYATTKADLLLFIKTDYGKHALQCAYDAHTQTLARTVAGAAATRDTVKHTIRRHIGTIGQFRISILPCTPIFKRPISPIASYICMHNITTFCQIFLKIFSSSKS